ncbi:hypothetical protein XENTR_v10003412 [Xenopus tropicalis]|nr:hypothetical protein XENTR_v10003412 [Xenopus tropicalis]
MKAGGMTTCYSDSHTATNAVGFAIPPGNHKGLLGSWTLATKHSLKEQRGHNPIRALVSQETWLHPLPCNLFYTDSTAARRCLRQIELGQ